MEKGDIVWCRPHWPNKPAFGIWTRDTVLTSIGKPARLTSDPMSQQSVTVQFDRDGDWQFNDCHWGVRRDEITPLAHLTPMLHCN